MKEHVESEEALALVALLVPRHLWSFILSWCFFNNLLWSVLFQNWNTLV
jgi:hypothetical protein